MHALRSIDDLAPCFRRLYPSFKYFNVVQSDCFPVAYGSDYNMVVSAPTGSGKTVAMEPGRLKVVYIAPTRSLVQERVRDWSDRFGNGLTVKVTELTGDIENIQSKEIDEADIICATPEKFDAVSRKHQDYGGTRFFGDISLVLIDEVHLLNETRGSVLEAGVVSRIRVVSKLDTMKDLCIAAVRFVAVSATIPNAGDLATWLSVPPEGLLVYGEEVRPVKITTIVKGYYETKNDFLFERRLNDFLYPVIAEYSKARPTLVFCRKGTSDTANFLVEQSTARFPNRVGTPFVRDVLHSERLTDVSKKASSKQLQQCLLHGIAFHHAGMDASDRAIVETAFLHQDILVLCTTGTLAMGVNLPAHLVVIKGTRYYCGLQERGPDQNGYKEYERGMCLQMIGRAGRPQFDTEGVAIIMTQRQHVPRYENLAQGCEALESQLKTCFAEYMNAEIVLGTIKTLTLAVEWLKSTFMYIRAMKNPALYGIPTVISSQQKFDAIMSEKFIISNLNLLQKHKMACESQLQPVNEYIHRLMAYYYIRLNTMIRITESHPRPAIPDLMTIISKADELESIRLRRGEKRVLNDVNCRRTNASIRFQVVERSGSEKPKQRISTSDEKIFILLNDALSRTPAESIDVSLRQETTQILKVAETIARCMTRYFVWLNSIAGSANARVLLKAVRAQMWEDSDRQCKQLPNIGKLLSERLVKGGLGKLQDLIQADPRRIEALTMKHYPFGSTLLQELQKRMRPQLDLQILAIGLTGDGRLKVQVTLQRTGGGDLCQAQFMGCSFLCGTIHNDRLLLHQSFNLKTFQSPYTVHLCVERPDSEWTSVVLVASVFMDKLIGMDVVTKEPLQFDVQSLGQNVPSPQHPMGQKGSEVIMEDQSNNASAVIQRLSAVEESSSPPKPAQPSGASSPTVKDSALAKLQPPIQTASAVAKETDSSSDDKNNDLPPQTLKQKCADVKVPFCHAQSAAAKPSAGPQAIGSVRKIYVPRSFQLQLPSTEHSRHECSSHPTATTVSPSQLLGIPGSRPDSYSKSARRDASKTCPSPARVSSNMSVVREFQRSDTMKYLKQKQQRGRQDWAASARETIQARNRLLPGSQFAGPGLCTEEFNSENDPPSGKARDSLRSAPRWTKRQRLDGQDCHSSTKGTSDQGSVFRGQGLASAREQIPGNGLPWAGKPDGLHVLQSENLESERMKKDRSSVFSFL